MRIPILLVALASASFAPAAFAQQGENTQCQADLQKASSVCEAQSTPVFDQCMSERAGSQCLKDFESGKSDAECSKRAKEAFLPCMQNVLPIVRQCLVGQVGPQCAAQLGVIGKPE